MKKYLLSLGIILAGFITLNTSNAKAETTSKEMNQSPNILWGAYCCDFYGNRRCALNDWYPVGNPCFCYGQGNGYVCY